MTCRHSHIGGRDLCKLLKKARISTGTTSNNMKLSGFKLQSAILLSYSYQFYLVSFAKTEVHRYKRAEARTASNGMPSGGVPSGYRGTSHQHPLSIATTHTNNL